jgi:hypothetical protein
MTKGWRVELNPLPLFSQALKRIELLSRDLGFSISCKAFPGLGHLKKHERCSAFARAASIRHPSAGGSDAGLGYALIPLRLNLLLLLPTDRACVLSANRNQFCAISIHFVRAVSSVAELAQDMHCAA